jgi:protein TonB
MKSFAGFATCILALTISIAQAQPPQKSKPRRLTVSGGVLQGKATKKVSPAYPPIARAARAAGKVEVQVTISEQGEVIEALVVSGHPLLRDAAVDAAKQWVFTPTELSGVPVKVQGVLAFNFTLQ